MAMARIEAILFDLGGVLIELAGVERMLAWSPSLCTTEELWRRWLASPAVRGYESGRTGRDAFADGIIEEFALPVSREAFLAEFAHWPRTLNAGARGFLAALAPRYSCTGNASSANGRCRRCSTAISRRTPWAGSSPTPTTSIT